MYEKCNRFNIFVERLLKAAFGRPHPGITFLFLVLNLAWTVGEQKIKCSIFLIASYRNFDGHFKNSLPSCVPLFQRLINDCDPFMYLLWIYSITYCPIVTNCSSIWSATSLTGIKRQ